MYVFRFTRKSTRNVNRLLNLHNAFTFIFIYIYKRNLYVYASVQPYIYYSGASEILLHCSVIYKYLSIRGNKTKFVCIHISHPEIKHNLCTVICMYGALLSLFHVYVFVGSESGQYLHYTYTRSLSLSQTYTSMDHKRF